MYKLKGGPEELDRPLVSHKTNLFITLLKSSVLSPISPTPFPQFVADLYERIFQTQPGLLC